MSSITEVVIVAMSVILIVVYETKRQKKSRMATTFTASFGPETDPTQGEIPMSTPITVDRQRVVTIDPNSIKDAKGRAAKIDGKFTYALSKDGNFSLFPSDDGLSCAVVGTDPTLDGEVVNLLISADADLSTGEKFIRQSLEITCTPAQATTFGVSFGEETDPA